MLGLLEFLLCLFSLFDFGNDNLIADLHTHGVNRCACGGWKNITRIDRTLSCVAISLQHRDIGDDAGYIDFNSRIFERQVIYVGITLDKKIFSDTATLVLLLTIVSIAGIHFYELGFCRHFGIPTEFISFELNKYSFLLFTFIAAFFFSTMIVDGVVGHIISFSAIKNKFVRIILILLIIAATIFALKSYLIFLKLQEVLILLVVILFGAILISNTNKLRRDN